LRADEGTRTADLISFRVIGQALYGYARVCKRSISKRFSLLWLVPWLHRIAFPVASEWGQTVVQSKECPRRDFPKAVQMISVVMSVSLELDCGAGSADHKHAASLTYLDGLVIYVNPYDHVCSHLLCLSNRLLGSRLSRSPQRSLVACGAAFRCIPQTRKQIPRKALASRLPRRSRSPRSHSRAHRLWRRWPPSRHPVASTTIAILTSRLTQETREETSCKERRLSAKDLATSSFSDSRSALANSARRRPKYAP
jgi:hypothetical protein